MKRSLIVIIALTLVLGYAGRAQAGNPTANMTVDCTVVAAISISISSNLNFGNVSKGDTGYATATILTTGDGTGTFYIAIGEGDNGGTGDIQGTDGNNDRNMWNTGATQKTLPYTLFSVGQDNTAWNAETAPIVGATTNLVSVGNGTGVSTTVYGTVGSAGTSAADSGVTYADTVVVTLVH